MAFLKFSSITGFSSCILPQEFLPILFVLCVVNRSTSRNGNERQGSSTRVTLSSPHSPQGFKMPRWPLANPRGWSLWRVEGTKSCFIESEDLMIWDARFLKRNLLNNMNLKALSLKGNSQTPIIASVLKPSKINAWRPLHYKVIPLERCCFGCCRDHKLLTI